MSMTWIKWFITLSKDCKDILWDTQLCKWWDIFATYLYQLNHKSADWGLQQYDMHIKDHIYLSAIFDDDWEWTLCVDSGFGDWSGMICLCSRLWQQRVCSLVTAGAMLQCCSCLHNLPSHHHHQPPLIYCLWLCVPRARSQEPGASAAVLQCPCTAALQPSSDTCSGQWTGADAATSCTMGLLNISACLSTW